MTIMTWNDELSVDIPEIDAEHKRLVEVINHFHDSMTQGRGRQELSNVMNELIEYAKTHFVHEENLMERANYEGLANHQKAHESFTRKVLELQNRYSDGDLALTVEVSIFLKDWLIHHVLGMDKAYSLVVRKSMGLA